MKRSVLAVLLALFAVHSAFGGQTSPQKKTSRSPQSNLRAAASTPAAPDRPTPLYEAYAVAEAADGKVLEGQNLHLRWPQASLTKLICGGEGCTGRTALRYVRAIAETRPKPAYKPPTGAEMNALGYYQRASESIKDAEALEGSIAKKGLIGQGRLQYGPILIQKEDEQQYRQAQRAFTEARLRKESGAGSRRPSMRTTPRPTSTSPEMVRR